MVFMPGHYERTPEIRRKLGEALRGHSVSQETRDKISAGNKGKKASKEHRRKNSEAHKGQEMTSEAKKKRAATMAAKEEPGPNYKDRRSTHPHYNRWYSMMTRCFSADHPTYRHYGARGIAVCEEWCDPWTFFRYLDEVLGPCSPGQSLDRIDVDGDYEPGNVRWATRIEQAANRRPRRLYKLKHSAPCVWKIEPWQDKRITGVQPIFD
jgi:hypothetical protein